MAWTLFSAHAVLAQEGERGRPSAFEKTPTPRPTLRPGETPTPDRLAAPPTVPSPNQADEGAQLYWLNCQPCHGDVGQGLTDEWRRQYPLEDRNCWESGCHGDDPYEQGFTIPTVVPAVIGPQTLTRFQSIGGLFVYTQATMPHWNPNSLTEKEYLAITAHLAHENGFWDATTLTADNVHTFPLPFVAGEVTTTPAVSSTPAVNETALPGELPIKYGGRLLGAALIIAAITAVGGFWLWNRRNH